MAQAHFTPETWFRAVYDGNELVGFVMLYDPTLAEAPEEHEFFLWRLMIDQRFQARGFGRATVGLLSEHLRRRTGARRLMVSHVKHAERLGRFYSSLGFGYTGREEDGELEMALELC